MYCGSMWLCGIMWSFDAIVILWSLTVVKVWWLMLMVVGGVFDTIVMTMGSRNLFVSKYSIIWIFCIFKQFKYLYPKGMVAMVMVGGCRRDPMGRRRCRPIVALESAAHPSHRSHKLAKITQAGTRSHKGITGRQRTMISKLPAVNSEQYVAPCSESQNSKSLPLS